MIEKIYLKQLGIEALQAYLKNNNKTGIISIIHENNDLFWIFKVFDIILKDFKLNIYDEKLQNLIKEILNKNSNML